MPSLPDGVGWRNAHNRAGGGRSAAVRGALQLADLLRFGIPGLDPPSYVTTAGYCTFEHMARVPGRGPTSSSLKCPLLRDALGLRQGDHLDFPLSREWEKRLTVDTEHCSPRAGSTS